MGGCGVEIEGLAHIILWGVVGGAAPGHIGAAAVGGVAGDSLEAALDKERRDALTDKAVMVATNEHHLFGEGIGGDTEAEVAGGSLHLGGEA